MKKDNKIEDLIAEIRAKEKSQPETYIGVGWWNDLVSAFATEKHPTMSAGTKYTVHSSHVPYLTEKGYIENLHSNIKQ